MISQCDNNELQKKYKAHHDYTTRKLKSNPLNSVREPPPTRKKCYFFFFNDFVKKKFIMVFIKGMPPLGYAESCWYF